MPRLKICTALNERGAECGRPILEGAPLSLCSLHILVAWQYAEEIDLFQAVRITDRPRVPKQREKPPTDVVYYLRFQDRIKIGTTTDLTQRLSNIPHDRLLAIEPGGRHLEHERHAQFADAHAYREWFHPTTDLLEHIDTVLMQHGNPDLLWSQIAEAHKAFILKRLAAQGVERRPRE